MFESAEGYQNYLKCMQIMHLQNLDSVTRIEAAAELPRFQPPLLHAIEQDLESVCGRANANDHRNSVDPLKVSSVLSPSDTDWGRAYVVEGSAMGGRYMQRIAAEKLSSQFTSRYLESLSWSAAKRWPKFIEAIEAQNIDDAEVVHAAIHVFDSMRKIVESVLSDSANDRNNRSRRCDELRVPLDVED